MGNSRRFRPSPAILISTAALFVALGGIGYAASTVATRDIQNGAVTAKKLHKNAVTTRKVKAGAVNGAKVKDNSLTGGDIDESTLGEVPSSNHANSADTAVDATNADLATNARTVGGLSVRKVFFKALLPTAESPQLTALGLTLSLGCGGGGAPIANVSSGSNASELQGHAIAPAGTIQAYSDDNGFTNLNILQAGIGSGTLTYSTTGGAVVTMDYGYDTTTVFNGEAACAFWATVIEG